MLLLYVAGLGMKAGSCKASNAGSEAGAYLRLQLPEQAQECAWQCHSGLRQPPASGSAQALAHTEPTAPPLQRLQPALSRITLCQQAVTLQSSYRIGWSCC